MECVFSMKEVKTMASNWATSYTKRENPKTEPGSRIHTTYTLMYDKDGKRDLEPTGKIDIYQQIQSYRSSCDLKILLERYKDGDVMALESIRAGKQPLYGDFSDAPGTLAEYYQRISQAEADFAAMPVSVREKFNFSASEYFASIGSQYWADAVGIKPIAPVVEEKGDVKDESKHE